MLPPLKNRLLKSSKSAPTNFTVQSENQGTFAPCPFSLSQLVDPRKALVWRNLSVSERCTFLFPTSRLIRPSISRKSIYEKQVARTNMVQSEPFFFICVRLTHHLHSVFFGTLFLRADRGRRRAILSPRTTRSCTDSDMRVCMRLTAR